MINNKGVTLIEVMVAMVISVVVMMYGIGFFMRATKFEAGEFEYSFALQEVKRLIEEQRALSYNTHVANNRTLNPWYMRDASFSTNATTGFDVRYVEVLSTGASYWKNVTASATWPTIIADPYGRKNTTIRCILAAPYVRRV